jgi:hypothetical protein
MQLEQPKFFEFIPINEKSAAVINNQIFSFINKRYVFCVSLDTVSDAWYNAG